MPRLKLRTTIPHFISLRLLRNLSMSTRMRLNKHEYLHNKSLTKNLGTLLSGVRAFHRKYAQYFCCALSRSLLSRSQNGLNNR
ncbi:Uncharacterized protein HZ326_4160 [Fusarium oxysporum f. sp. albedinis]|nr:Uncharacterized protein HZ326_4160 [Fusarium oxysporum f. sp. albedinis]